MGLKYLLPADFFSKGINKLPLRTKLNRLHGFINIYAKYKKQVNSS